MNKYTLPNLHKICSVYLFKLPLFHSITVSNPVCMPTGMTFLLPVDYNHYLLYTGDRWTRLVFIWPIYPLVYCGQPLATCI